MICKRCGRGLKSKESQLVGYGPSCYVKTFGTKKFPKGQKIIEETKNE